MENIKAYKGFNPDMTCRGKQYEEGKDYEEERAEACECGMHACEYPLDCFSYYAPGSSVYHEVEQSGNVSRNDEDSKIASTKMHIGARLDIAGLVKAAINFTKKNVKENVVEEKAATAGDQGAATAGDQGAATAGDQGAAISRGNSSAGDYGVAIARGTEVKAKAGKGGLIVIIKEDCGKIVSWKAEIVDGEKIKADTWYCLIHGKLVERDEV